MPAVRPANSATPEPSRTQEITALLQAARGGDNAASEKLAAAVYDDFRKVARRYMASERAGHTLQPTLLVDEVLMRLLPHSPADIDWENRAHFKNVAAHQMRRLLIDHARQKRAAKRSFGVRIDIEDMRQLPARPDSGLEFEALNNLLDVLATRDPDSAKVIELKFFGGLTDEQTAAVMNTNLGKVRRDWEFGRSWLRHRLSA